MLKCLARLLFIGSLLIAQRGGFGQDPSSPGMISLLANPERFDGKLVTVFGFLTLDRQEHHAPKAFIFLHEEDANNLLPNGAEVVPSEQMLRDAEKINGEYVTLTGLAHIVAGGNNSRGIVIEDVRNCRVWSDPRRPIGLRKEEEIQKK